MLLYSLKYEDEILYILDPTRGKDVDGFDGADKGINYPFHMKRELQNKGSTEFMWHLGHRSKKWFWGYLFPSIIPEGFIYLPPNRLIGGTIAQFL